jgi:hypothetical protein
VQRGDRHCRESEQDAR